MRLQLFDKERESKRVRKIEIEIEIETETEVEIATRAWLLLLLHSRHVPVVLLCIPRELLWLLYSLGNMTLRSVCLRATTLKHILPIITGMGQDRVKAGGILALGIMLKFMVMEVLLNPTHTILNLTNANTITKGVIPMCPTRQTCT